MHKKLFNNLKKKLLDSLQGSQSFYYFYFVYEAPTNNNVDWPAIAEGPNICQRKNIANAIWSGLAQAMLR